MKKMTNKTYVANYDELVDLINDGYYPVGELKHILDHNFLHLLRNKVEIEIYLDHDNKILDINEFVNISTDRLGILKEECALKSEVQLKKLIATFKDMANRETLLTYGDQTQRDVLINITGIIIRTVIEDELESGINKDFSIEVILNKDINVNKLIMLFEDMTLFDGIITYNQMAQIIGIIVHVAMRGD